VTTTCRDLRPLLGAYVLGALEPDEAAAVREHVAACPACATEQSRLAPLPGLLTLAAGAQRVVEEPPSPAMEERLLDTVAREAPRRRARLPRRRRILGFAAAGLTAAALAATGIAVVGGGDPPYVHLRATSASTGATAKAELSQVDEGTVMHLWVSGLPRDSAAVYEVHCDAPGWSESAGTFRVNGQGRAYVELNTAARRGQYDRIRITRKTAAGERLVFAAAVS
jgi:anti-sigma factor RsiW